MSNKKTRLELTWIGKNERSKLEPRILLEDPDKSYHTIMQHSENFAFDNKLIFGDNLLALKALEQTFSNKIKCVFIDPPYNTGNAFEHYDDGVEHSLWLSLMRDRLDIIRNLISDDGSLWITIDDNEAHYLKVMCDEIFGRSNFIANAIWQKRYSPANDAIGLSQNHDHILIYAKNKNIWSSNLLPRNEKSNSSYSNPDNDERGEWMSDNYTCNKSDKERPNLYYPITNPNTGEEIWPKRTAVWRYSRDTHLDHIKNNLIWWGKNGTNSVPRFKRFQTQKGRKPDTIWLWEEVGHNQDAKREQLALFPDLPFSTPKPEKLLERIILIATNPGDIILDSFAGSGTTGAVAQKMGRRWIMIELGEHCHSHIIPRLKKVIDGSDQGGISKEVNWNGGGGFKYYKLAPSLLEKDKWDNWVINRNYNGPMLSEALCKLEGFTYAPSDAIYWQQGYSTENDYIYVTTAHLTNEQLQQLSDEVGTERTLLILCTSFKSNIDLYPNLTVKKIPQHVLSRCEWGHDDYSLNVENISGMQLEQPQKHKSNEEMIFNEPTC